MQKEQYYNVFLDYVSVGFFTGSTWGDAQRKGAGHYNKDKDVDDKVPWEKFFAQWVNPKHYQEYGIDTEENS